MFTGIWLPILDQVSNYHLARHDISLRRLLGRALAHCFSTSTTSALSAQRLTLSDCVPRP